MPTRSIDAKRAKYPNDLKRTGLFGTPTFNGIGDAYDKRPHGKVSASKLRPFKPGDDAKSGHNACFSPFPAYHSDPIQDQEAKEREARKAHRQAAVKLGVFCATSSAKSMRQVSVQQHPLNTLRSASPVNIPPTYLTATHNPAWTATE